MCEIIEEIQAAQLEMVIRRARKQMASATENKEEKPIEVAVAAAQ